MADPTEEPETRVDLPGSFKDWQTMAEAAVGRPVDVADFWNPVFRAELADALSTTDGQASECQPVDRPV